MAITNPTVSKVISEKLSSEQLPALKSRYNTLPYDQFINAIVNYILDEIEASFAQNSTGSSLSAKEEAALYRSEVVGRVTRAIPDTAPAQLQKPTSSLLTFLASFFATS